MQTTGMYLFFQKLTLTGSFLLGLLTALPAQTPADSLRRLLWGRWELVAYSEQGVPVDKKAASLPQARVVYQSVRVRRAFTSAPAFRKRSARSR